MTETPQHDRVHTENLRDVGSLRRSVTDRKVAGVAGGLGRHLNIDPTILRVLFVVLCFFGGAGFVAYGALWLLVPEEGKEHGVIETNDTARTVLLVVAGVLAALMLVGDSWGGFGFPWPLAVLAVVVFVILMNREKPMNNQPPQQPAAAEPPARTPAAGSGVITATAPAGETTSYDYQPPAPPWAPPVPQAYEPPQPPPDRGPLLFGPTLALVAVALGALGLYDVAGGSVTGSAYAALALAVVGAMLVVGAWVGRAGGLVLLGLVAAFALAVSSVVQGGWSRTWEGDRRLAATPFSAAAVHDGYSIPAGQIRLDLSRVQDLEALDGRHIDVHANVGEIIVILPSNLSADVNADVSGPGDISFDDRNTGGIGTHVDRVLTDGDDVGLVTLNLDLSVGHIEVRQQ